MPTVTVTVSQSLTQAYYLTISPQSLPVPGTDSTTIMFDLKQPNLSGWQFPTSSGTDEFFGVSITGDNGTEFTSPQYNSPTQVQFTDANNNSTRYTYTVEVTNPGLGLSLGIDPTIDNRSEN